MGEALIVRRGGTGGGGGGSYTVTLTSLLPSGTETVTYTGTASGTVSIVNGTGSVLLPTGTYTFTSSDTVWTSGTVAVTGNISINCWYGTPVYWYGNMLNTGGWYKGNSSMGYDVESNCIGVSSGSTGTNRQLATENTYDLTNFSSINAYYYYNGSNYTGYIGYGTVKSAGYNNAIQTERHVPLQVGTISLTQHPSAAYLYFGCNAGSTRSYLYAMWLN